jgi:hypothetical protein
MAESAVRHRDQHWKKAPQMTKRLYVLIASLLLGLGSHMTIAPPARAYTPTSAKVERSSGVGVG